MRWILLPLALLLAAPAVATPTPAVSATAATGRAAPLSLDRATAEQLAALDGVDATLARDIVSLRTARGGHLSSVDELRVLPSMTQAALSSLRSNTGVELALGSSGKTYTSVEEVLGEFANEPSVQMVQRWTDDYARTSPDMIRSWNSASRGFAALPRLQLEYWLRNDWDRDFKYNQVGESFETEPEDINEGQADRILVRTQWDLSELVMSSDRIRIINESQDAVKLRDKLLSQVTRLYFDRRRHQVEMLLNPRSSLEGQVEDELRLLELTASIDALTGGQFSRSLRGGG